MNLPATALDRTFWRLGILDRASPLRANARMITVVAVFHALALLACIPWLFSWWGVGLWLGGHYLFGTLGMTVGYHRLLSHRGFTCPRWLEHTLAGLGICCWEGTPMSWVAVHRMHHQHSDEEGDPHSPKTHGFFWSHMGWFLLRDPAIYNINTYDRYVRDLFQDRYYKKLEKPGATRIYHVVQWAAFLVLGAIVGAITEFTLLSTVQMALSFLVWGVFVRTVAVWHVTWSVNSLTHLWGYRSYPTSDDSRNNWMVALISGGEGWHNNHHAEPRCASHGQRWWEFDHTYITIRALEVVGLASNIVKPKRRLALEQAEEQKRAA